MCMFPRPPPKQVSCGGSRQGSPLLALAVNRDTSTAAVTAAGVLCARLRTLWQHKELILLLSMTSLQQRAPRHLCAVTHVEAAKCDTLSATVSVV